MFGLGMNNNGTGLVLASMALADHPQVLLPIIFYNLVQHLIAGTVDRFLFRRPANAQQSMVMFPELATYVAERVTEFTTIPVQRRAELEALAKYMRGQRLADRPVLLVFVCTHNSRRSQLAQAWAAAAAAHYGIDAIGTYSGGTEATAFNPRAVAALQRAGWNIQEVAAGDNPIYGLSFGEQTPALRCFSKVLSEEPNPRAGFAAVMVCASGSSLSACRGR